MVRTANGCLAPKQTTEEVQGMETPRQQKVIKCKGAKQQTL